MIEKVYEQMNFSLSIEGTLEVKSGHGPTTTRSVGRRPVARHGPVQEPKLVLQGQRLCNLFEFGIDAKFQEFRTVITIAVTGRRIRQESPATAWPRNELIV